MAEDGAEPLVETTQAAAGGSMERAAGKAGSAPVYLQLASLLREKIALHEWTPGSRIPSEHELMARFDISRGTARRAISELVDEGLLVQVRGSGTIVSERALSHPAGERPLSFGESLREQGKDFVTHVIEKRVVPAPADVAEHLRIQLGSPVLYLLRVRTVQGEPVICQEGWENLDECPGLEDADFSRETAFDAVERCSGRKITWSKVRYSAATAGERASVLGCSEYDPMLVLRQTIGLADATVIEQGLTWLRAGQEVAGTSVQDGWLPTSLAPELCGAERRRLSGLALDIRRAVVEFAHANPSLPFHLGGSLSAAEILAVLYGGVMRTGADGTPWEQRDRFVLSKGHASLALYPALLHAGLISNEDIERGLLGPNAVLFKHPRRDPARGIETSGGSLGMGLGYVCGLAIAAQRKGLSSRVFCLLGDGECNEGSVWESAALAGHLGLAPLTVIVDVNGLQLDGPTAQILDTGSLAEKFRAFGFEAIEVDGHDVSALWSVLAPTHTRPRVVLAHTTKGKGLSFAENCVEWHDNKLSDELYAQALRELGREGSHA